MTKYVIVNAYRGGTGKSNIVANLALMLAARGQRVGLVDANFQLPEMHVLFGFDENAIPHPLNDFMLGKCAISDVALDVSAKIDTLPGQIHLLTAVKRPKDVEQLLQAGYAWEDLLGAFDEFAATFALDFLIFDTHQGMGETAITLLGVSDTLIMVVRPDVQDLHGTQLMVSAARELELSQIFVWANLVPPAYAPDELQQQLEATYGCEVIAVLPHSRKMVALEGAGLFALKHPDDPITAAFEQAADRLLAPADPA